MMGAEPSGSWMAVLVNANSEQRDLILRAMREVATGANREPITDADRAALVSANTYVFRNPEPIDPDALAPITPDELAAGLDDVEVANHAAQFLAVMATIDGTVDEAKISSVLRYADALGVHEDYLRQLAELGRKNLQWLIADVQRQNLLSITGRDLDITIDAWILPYHDHPNPDLVTRHEALGRLPEGTFGRTFFDFYKTNGFEFAGAPDSVNDAFATPHDSTHVLSGYDTTPQGELLVSTFTAGMHPHEPMSGHILPVIMTWHMGVELVHFAGKYSGGLDPEKFWVAWDRGSEVATDAFALGWDFWAVVDAPLDELREQYRVPPLDPRHAAGGEVPSWYRPSA
jgi:hypothetical protein